MTDKVDNVEVAGGKDVAKTRELDVYGDEQENRGAAPVNNNNNSGIDNDANWNVGEGSGGKKKESNVSFSTNVNFETGKSNDNSAGNSNSNGNDQSNVREYPIFSVHKEERSETKDFLPLHRPSQNGGSSLQSVEEGAVECSSDIEKEVRAHRSVSTVVKHLGDPNAGLLLPPASQMSNDGHSSSLNEESVRAFVASTSGSRRVSSASNFSYDGQRLSFDVSFFKAPDRPSPFFSPEEQEHVELLHGVYPVIKYREKALIPHTRLLTLDRSNTHLVWWNPSLNKLQTFLRKKTLDIGLIKEIRVGQNTKNFMRFPFEGVEGQSISLLYEQEFGQWGYLRSLDLIFETEEHFDIWREGLCLLVNDACRHVDYYASFDPTFRWLKRYWISMSKDKEGNTGYREVAKFAKNLGKKFKALEVKRLYGKALDMQPQPSNHHTVWGVPLKTSSLSWEGFRKFFQLLNPRDDILWVFRQNCNDPKTGMTLIEFLRFLTNVQKMDITEEDAIELVKKHGGLNSEHDYANDGSLLSAAGFRSFLLSGDNDVFCRLHKTVYMDMDQPLPHYFISASHNTYLMGNQLNSESSTEAYVRALLMGCRCIELDLWNGSDGYPIIFHGHTLTTKISAEDVIRAINEYAFRTSRFPLILSFENHCSLVQQRRLARMCRDIFGERLVTSRLDPHEKIMPSPNALSGKILVKGKINMKIIEQEIRRAERSMRRDTALRRVATRKATAQSCGASATSLESTHRDSSENMGSSENLNSVLETIVSAPSPPGELENEGSFGDLTNPSLFSLPEMKSETALEIPQEEDHKSSLNPEDLPAEDEMETEFTEVTSISKEITAITPYFQTKPFKSFVDAESNFRHCDLISLGEKRAELCAKRYAAEFAAYNISKTSRVYPSGRRFDSSNYDPHKLWNAGCHMVSLNYQTPDRAMHLNLGKFAQNGNCGYVLKPLALRDPSYNFDPNETAGKSHTKSKTLKLKIISGQFLTRPELGFKGCSPIVHCEIFGVPGDTLQQQTRNIRKNGLDPEWDETFTFTCDFPELALVYFWVENVSSSKKKAKFLGQNCFPFCSLERGFRHIQLKTATGELTPVSSLFVHISIDDIENDFTFVDKEKDDTSQDCLTREDSDGNVIIDE
eukprot:Nk52_evm38s242 gene=Nk52_evmTU38s242